MKPPDLMIIIEEDHRTTVIPNDNFKEKLLNKSSSLNVCYRKLNDKSIDYQTNQTNEEEAINLIKEDIIRIYQPW